MKKIFILIFYATIISSCGTFAPIDPPHINTYQINIPVTPQVCINKNTDTLIVGQMYALRPFNTNKIWFSTLNNQLSAYGYNQWVTSPSEMLTDNIIQYLNAQCVYSRVVSDDFMTNGRFRLNTQLIRLSLDALDKKTVVNLSIVAQLVDNKTNSVIKNKTFMLSSSSDNTPVAMVEVTNQLNKQFLLELTTWLSTQ